MNILIITNPKSGKSHKCEELTEYIKDKQNAQIVHSNKPDHIKEIVKENIDKVDTIVAAGGDGTINDVVNALDGNFNKISLGIIPLGTGNDLARTLDIPIDPIEAFNLIESSNLRQIDLIQIETENKISYCINMSAGGFSGQVDEILDESMKKTWGPLAYLMGAITALPDLKEYKTKIISEDEELKIEQVLNIVVANGRTVAGGKKVANFSSPEDGFLDLIIVRNDTPLKLAAVAGKIAIGANYIDGETVLHKRVKSVEIISKPGMWFNSDGELLSKAPVKFSILPKILSTFTGQNYMAYPEEYKEIINSLE